MMHICYIHIFSFGVLNNIGLSFDHRYRFKIEKRELKISSNQSGIPNTFWGAGIYSLTAIVGNNGCGKTTALRLMKKLFVEGAPRKEEAEVMIVYETRGSLYVYNPKRLRITATPDIHFEDIQQRRTIETLYYSGHFQPYSGEEDIELMGSYEASDGWLLVHDLQEYANVDSLHLSEPLYNHLNAYYAQNNYRICEILTLDGLRDLLKTVRLPRYVQFAPNKGGWNAIKLDRMGKFYELDLPAERLTSADLREQAVERLVYYDILNLIAEGKGEQKELNDFLKEWVYAPKVNGVVKALEERIVCGEDASEANKALSSLHYVMQKLESICEFDEKSRTFYVDVEKDKNKLQSLIKEMIRSPYFLTARFFDIVYSHNLTEKARLSSGEQELLNLLSRLYYGITIKPQKFSNIESPRLLLLDEAEIGFHPDWQLKYVKMLTEFMSYMMVKAGVDFQIVITSHSPIILSDIPVSCVNYLRRKGSKTRLVDTEEETFGENVFRIYRQSFFMEKGLVGEFAREKIKALEKAIKAGDSSEATRRQVGIIGDERIRDYLRQLMARRDVDAEIAYYEEKVRQLRRRKEQRDE